jgi:hypothetical protein
MQLPTTPNRPLLSPDEPDVMGSMRLRTQPDLGFTENADFRAELVRYDEHYQNSQAGSALFQHHMQRVCDIIKARFPLDAKIVEVGCGKGDFVALLEANEFRNVAGFDAAYEGDRANISARYLTDDDRIDADLVVLRHTVEHVVAPHHFLAMLARIFSSGCEVYLEVPCFDWIRKNGAFFDVTYEHVNYFTLESLCALFDGVVVERGRMFGDQYIYCIAKLEERSVRFGALYDSGPWLDEPFEALFPTLLGKMELVEATLEQGGRLYLWGAATKGCLFLYHCSRQQKIAQSIAFAIDINPGKIGKYLPGSGIPIRSPDALFSQAGTADLLCIANPNYFDEILSELKQHGLSAMNVICL